MRQSRTAGRAPASARRLALTSLGAGLAVAAAAPVASAATVAAPEAAMASTWSRLGTLRLYPLAGTGIDPLSNVVGTSLGGIPVSTQPVTDAFSDGLPVADLPVVGDLLRGRRG